MRRKPSADDLYALVGLWVSALHHEEGRSENTQLNYHFYLRRFRDFVGNQSIRNITLADVNNFRLYLPTLGLGPSTVNYHMIAVRQFFKWLGQNDYSVLAYINIKIPTVKRPTVTWLTDDEVKRLLDAPDISSELGRRDRAILEVLYAAGLRVSELVSLDRRSIDLLERTFTMRGKGDKTRIAFITPRAALWVQEYLNKRRDGHQAMFVTHDRDGEPTRLSVRGIQRVVDKYVKDVGITKTVSPHTFRHSFATNLRRNGAQLDEVQKLLGHANIMTTEIYTHLTDDDLKQTHEKYSSQQEQPND